MMNLHLYLVEFLATASTVITTSLVFPNTSEIDDKFFIDYSPLTFARTLSPHYRGGKPSVRRKARR